MFGIPFLTPQILGALGIALVAAIGGAWGEHKWDGIALSKAQAQTAAIDAAFTAYKGSIAASVAKADADALAQRQAQEARANALQEQLIQAQKVNDAKSAQLRDILNKAAPQDTRDLGPIARHYLEQLRGTGSNPAAAIP